MYQHFLKFFEYTFGALTDEMNAKSTKTNAHHTKSGRRRGSSSMKCLVVECSSFFKKDYLIWLGWLTLQRLGGSI